MQPAVLRLKQLGPIRAEVENNEVWWRDWVEALDGLNTPVTDEEAITLAALFSDCEDRSTYFTLVHVIETAPGWPIASILNLTGNEGIDVLKVRWDNYKKKMT